MLLYQLLLRDNITYIITFIGFIPPFFIGTDIDIPSGISCKHIAIASEYPNVIDAPNPEPIANPSGKLCSANPILTIIPVFNKLFVLFLLLLNFFSTNMSHISITIIPAIIPIITFIILAISIASGIRSKHTIASINPDANANIKLRNFFDVFLKQIPIIPPIVVPNVPKNNPISVVFIKYSNIFSPIYYFSYYMFYLNLIFTNINNILLFFNQIKTE